MNTFAKFILSIVGIISFQYVVGKILERAAMWEQDTKEDRWKRASSSALKRFV